MLLGLIPEADAIVALLDDPALAVTGPIPPAAQDLERTAAAVSFTSPTTGQLLLIPGVAALALAMSRAADDDDDDDDDEEGSLGRVDVKKVMVAVTKALAAALDNQSNDLVDPAGSSFRVKAFDTIRTLQSFVTENPAAAVPVAMLRETMAWLSVLSRLQQRNDADLAAVAGDGDDRVADVRALRAIIEQGAAEPSPAVNVLTMAQCELTVNCPGRHAYFDPLCQECGVWKPGWVCSGCGYVTLMDKLLCFDDKCSGTRPNLPLPREAIPGDAQVDAQNLLAYGAILN
jgi:hypothetical protein